MNDKIQQIFHLPLGARLGILGGTAALVIGTYFFFFYSPVAEQLDELRSTIDKQQLEIAEKRGIAANLPKYVAEVERLDVELAKALRELPDKKSIDELLSQISDKARDAGLDINLFQPTAEQMKDFYAEIPVQIEVMGTYHQVATFFDEVGHLARIVNVNDFSLEQPVKKEEELMLKTTAVATSFRFLDESERPKQGDEKKKKRRRRGGDE